jgi:basic amino acid/polyamine antiporter, APA family
MASKVTPEAAGAAGVAANAPKESHELRRAAGVWGSYTWGYAYVYDESGIVIAADQGATKEFQSIPRT